MASIVSLPHGGPARQIASLGGHSIRLDENSVFLSRLCEQSKVFGYNLAKFSRAQEREDAHLQAIAAHAEGLCLPHFRGPFEPQGRDALRQQEHERNLKARKECELRLSLAKTTLLSREKQCADTERNKVEAPGPIWKASLLGGAAASLSFIPGLYDFLVDHTRADLTFSISAIAAFTLGAFYTYVALAPFRRGRRDFTSHLPLIAGLLLCTAFTAIRVHGLPPAQYGWWMPYALFGVEFAVILALEFLALSHAAAYAEWVAYESERAARAEEKRIAEELVAERTKDLQEIEIRSSEFQTFCDECAALSENRDEILDSVSAAGVGGYEEALAENVGEARRG